jgi:hypothetical protein
MTKPNRLHRERPSLSAVPPPTQSRHAAIEPKKEKRREPDIRETELPTARRSSFGFDKQQGTVRPVFLSLAERNGS